MNKTVVILRDGLFNIERDALPEVRDGEESLREDYRKALRGSQVAGHSSVGLLLKKQMEDLHTEIARLPTA